MTQQNNLIRLYQIFRGSWSSAYSKNELRHKFFPYKTSAVSAPIKGLTNITENFGLSSRCFFFSRKLRNRNICIPHRWRDRDEALYGRQDERGWNTTKKVKRGPSREDTYTLSLKAIIPSPTFLYLRHSFRSSTPPPTQAISILFLPTRKSTKAMSSARRQSLTPLRMLCRRWVRLVARRQVLWS